MTRKVTGRASQRDLDTLHGLVTRELKRQFRKHAKEKTDAPQPLIANALKHLALADTTRPDPAKDKSDPLKDDMPDFSNDTVIPPREEES